MTYKKFILYNFVGGLLWVNIFVWLGYFFGNLSFIKKHFEIAILAIIFISVLPMVYEFVKSKLEARKEKVQVEA
jgi:membrane-associated protein